MNEGSVRVGKIDEEMESLGIKSYPCKACGAPIERAPMGGTVHYLQSCNCTLAERELAYVREAQAWLDAQPPRTDMPTASGPTATEIEQGALPPGVTSAAAMAATDDRTDELLRAYFPWLKDTAPAVANIFNEAVEAKAASRRCTRVLPLHPVQINADESSCWRCGNTELA